MATIKSIEEKAKRYDEAIKRLEDIEAGKCQKTFVFTEGLFDYIFPELKESEDERIMKALYKMAKVPRKEIYEAEGITKEQALAWLEKQGEQKPQGKTALEAINEEKVDNANKVEPQDEFTEFERAVKQVMEEAIECGDTHNLKADANMLLSLVQKPDEEYNITGIHSKHAEGKLGEMIKNLKTINEKQGEKPRYSIGDVLCDKSCTTLNKDAQPNFEILDIRNGLYICDKGYIPISQQDEYELVAKKIEQKPAWSEEDEKMFNVVHDLAWESYKTSRRLDIPTFGTIDSWLKYLKERIQLQPKQEWSEEDECCINQLIIFCENCMVQDSNTKKCANWLKSFKERYTWKPSDEQIKAVKVAACYSSVFGEKTIDNLISLSKDLKKLKG